MHSYTKSSFGIFCGRGEDKSHSILANLVICLKKYLNHKCNLMLPALQIFSDRH